MAARAEDNKAAFLKYISNKRNPNTGLGPLLGEDGKIVNTAAEKADVLNKYLRFIFVLKQDYALVLSSPLVQRMLSNIYL